MLRKWVTRLRYQLVKLVMCHFRNLEYFTRIFTGFRWNPNPKLDVFPRKKIGLKAWNFGFVSCNKTSPQIGSVHQNVRTCQPSAWGLGALRGVFLVPLFALDFLDDWKQSFGDQNDHSKWESSHGHILNNRVSRQFIATSDKVTPKGRLVRDSYECRQDTKVAWRSHHLYNRWISSTVRGSHPKWP